MGSPAYNALLNKYNTLVARCQSMQETMKSKDEQWGKKAREFKTVEDNTRDLCKMILAKDKTQINLGTDSGSWLTLPTTELITLAISSFKKYTKRQSETLQQILDLAEERGRTIEGLEDEVDFYRNNSGSSQEEYEKFKKEKETTENLNDAVSHLDPQTQQNIKDNNLELKVRDKDINQDTISDLLNDEVDSFTPTSQSVKTTVTGTSISHLKEQAREQKVFRKFRDEIDLGGIVEKMSETQKWIMQAIGAQGLSQLNDIVNMVNKEILKKNPKANKETNGKAIYAAYAELRTKAIVEDEKVVLPLQGQSNTRIVTFTSLGTALYRFMTGKVPVVSEATTIISDHDNIHHGYGIRSIYKALEASNLYNNVDMYCRKNPLLINNGTNQSYIPDIFAIHTATQKKCYFEYERGLSKTATIIDKCNKMSKFTRQLFFITDTKQSAEKLLKDLIEWQKGAVSRGRRDISIYLSSARFFQSQNFDITAPWQYTLNKGNAEPVTIQK